MLFELGSKFFDRIEIGSNGHLIYPSVKELHKYVLTYFHQKLGAKRFLAIYERIRSNNSIFTEKFEYKTIGRDKKLKTYMLSGNEYIKQVATKFLSNEDLLEAIESGRAELIFCGEKITDPRKYFTRELGRIQSILPKHLVNKTEDELNLIVEKFINDTV
jgi:hypothetical protein